MTTRVNVCADPMSTWNQSPFVIPWPPLQRVPRLPSTVCDGMSPHGLVDDALATHPARGSASAALRTVKGSWALVWPATVIETVVAPAASEGGTWAVTAVSVQLRIGAFVSPKR